MKNSRKWAASMLIVLGLAACSNKEKSEKSSTESESPQSMVEPAVAALSTEAEAGKAIFDGKCIACHKITDEKLLGPGLKGVTTRRTEDWIKKMVKNPDKMTAEDPEAKKLLEEYKTQMTNFNLTDDEVNNVFAYLKANDAQ
jgi:cytochrome c2